LAASGVTAASIPTTASLLTNVKVLFYTDDIPDRAFPTWTAQSIPKSIAPDPELLGTTEKTVLKCLEKLLALGPSARVDSIHSADSTPPSDAMIRLVREEDLPSNEIYLNLTANPDLPSLDEFLDIYAGVIDINLEEEVSRSPSLPFTMLPLLLPLEHVARDVSSQHAPHLITHFTLPPIRKPHISSSVNCILWPRNAARGD
jgi:hypothetical protein